MARVALKSDIAVHSQKSTSQGQALYVRPGARVHLYEHGTTTPITVYANEVGAATLAQPLTTDRNGYPPGWVDPQRVDVVVEGSTDVMPVDLGQLVGELIGDAEGRMAGTYPAPSFADASMEALADVTPATDAIPYFDSSSTAAVLTRDTDGGLAADSDARLPTQKAVKTYVDASSASTGAAAVVLAPSASARNVIQAPSASVVPLTTKGAASQTGDLIRHQDSAGNNIFKVPAAGIAEGLSTLAFTSSAGGVVTPAHTSVFRVDPQGNVLIGPNKIIKDGTQQNLVGWYPHSSVPEWIYDAITRRTYQRSTEVIELGDPADFVLGRMGTNNTYPDGLDGTAASLTGTLSGETLASIRFVGGVTPFGGTPGTTGGSSRQTTSAQISSQAAENFMQTTSGSTYATGADLRFWTTPVGAQTVAQRMRIFESGQVAIGVNNNVGQLLVQTTSASRAAITAQGAASQSTATVAVIDSAGTALSELTQSGGLRLHQTSSDIIRVQDASSAAHDVLKFRVGTDSADRYIVRVDGRTYYGDGTGARDLLVKRESAGVLAIRNGDNDNAYAALKLAGLTNSGAMTHTGTTVGFFGTTPATRASAYTPTNVSSDRSYDANATSIDELADVLGTLIGDLQSYGLLQ